MHLTVLAKREQRMVCLLLLLGAVWSAARAAETTFPPQFIPVVTNIMQLHRLASQQRGLVCSFRLEGVVCETSPMGALIFQDSSGADLLEADCSGPPTPSGQRVRLEGDNCLIALNDLGLEIRGAPLVNNDGIHALTRKSGTVYLKAGRHPLLLDWFNALGKQGLEVAWQGPGLARTKIPDTALFRAEANFAIGRTNLVSGLDYRAYEGEWNGFLPNFNRLSSVRSGTVTNFDLSVRTRDERVALEFSGYLEVPQDGIYTFDVDSDDGSRLFLAESRPRIETLGTAVVSPRRMFVAEPMRPEDQRQWAELEGTITFAGLHGSRLELELSSGTERMRVIVRDAEELEPALLLHSRIRVSGVCESSFTVEGHCLADNLSVLDARQITLLETPADLWTAHPALTISNALWAITGRTEKPMVHIVGRVRSCAPGKSLVIEDVTGRAIVETTQTTPNPEGHLVEAAGWRSGWGTNAVVRGGRYRLVPGSAATPAEPLPLLTSADQVKRLKREEAQRGYPVKIRGVVTRALPSTSQMVIQDSTRGVFVSALPASSSGAPRWGEYWEVEGVTGPGDFAPVVLARRAARLGLGHLPAPIPATWDRLVTGSLDTQYVEIQGIVTAIQANRLELLLPEGRINLSFSDLEPGSLPPCENALVRVRGCLFPDWDRPTHRVKVGGIGIRNASIVIEEPAPEDPFLTPLKPVADLLLFDPRASAFQRVKVAGQLLGRQAGQAFMFDDTNGLRFIAKNLNGLEAGDRVEVVGFPDLSGPSPTLREAVARKTGRATLPEARKLPGQDLIHQDLDATLVRVEGLLVNRRTERSEQVFEVQLGLRTVLARLPLAAEPMRPPTIGSTVELTGVYVGLGGNRASGRNIDSFELLLNSPTDLRVLASPPWWTLPRVLGALGAVALVLLGAMLWAFSLRRQVSAQTEIIRQKVQREATLEERTRIAQDIHDELGSNLTRIVMLGERLEEDIGRPDQLDSHIRKIVTFARSTVRSLNEIVWAVNPENDTLDGLIGYLTHYAEGLFDGSNLRCRLAMPVQLSSAVLPAEVRHDLFLVVKEALTNVLKHARASEVRIQISEIGSVVEIVIEDNGCGFDPSETALRRKGNGLCNMRKRVESLGGQLALTTALSHGTALKLTIDLALRPHTHSGCRTRR